MSFASGTWELSGRGGSYVDALVTDFHLKPFMTLADVSDLERALFEPFLSNFLPLLHSPSLLLSGANSSQVGNYKHVV